MLAGPPIGATGYSPPVATLIRVRVVHTITVATQRTQFAPTSDLCISKGLIVQHRHRTPTKSTAYALSVRTLVDPALAPGQFRKAVATASFGVISLQASGPTAKAIGEIVEVRATLDDETGKIQLVIVIAGRGNATTIVDIEELQFQVSTLARTA